MEIIFHKKALEYEMPGHPECPERVRLAYEYIKDRYEIVEPEYATEKDVRLVHTEELVKIVKMGQFYDADSPIYDNLFDYCLLAAGGAIKACKRNGFSLMRPPGHHAGRDFLGGFCYFNNLAIAVQKSGLKTIIVDIDGHHGNGTEDIFSGSNNITYISLHRQGIFPGTGWNSKKNVINCPLNDGCGDKVYLSTLEKALDIALNDDFEQMAISAGFDSYKLDPLASLGLSSTVYEKTGAMLSSINLPTFCVLEGGYVVEDMGKNIDSFLSGLSNKKQ